MWPADHLEDAPGDRTRLKNMQQLIQLRWLAVFGQIVTIEVAHYGFRIPLPLEPMLIVLAALIGFNVASLLRWRTGREATNTELFVAMLVDVATLTAQLYLSGGATNPFASLYLLQVILGAVLLQAWSSAALVVITGLCLIGLALFSRPLALPLDLDRGLASPYIQGMVLCFALNASLLLVFITRINANLRARDARLASLRQRAAEEEHIVRMGLLASGAAHELGTPLATLSVILGDWKRMPEFTSNPELLQEVDEMQAQLKRCKTIVSGILLSAGEARGESSTATTVVTFLDDLVQEWRDSRPVTTFVYENRFGHDLPMVSDSALKQTIHNVLDNALEASPHRVTLDVERVDDRLVLTVTDAGPGFAPHMLTQLGKPYQSSKGRPGGGLGLFLVVNVLRTLGGNVTAHNLAEGGALVRISLPLSAVILEEEEPNAS
ncbi:ATP-binding protein [Variovorax arabinosiphilus]|uniref:ATP-binding protein n=1 Tax=Variovorax arabinosiphilus TaxID=3053498 RepID=UPI002575954F|nr:MULTISPECIES: ATP-binding protein [unclassified Variovorax]MDM0118607.1 ATP-binding protein [Variovorax sp. J2L1-78]MDM0129032.1 ATP-binding protein [Variovorax sp. J2L1-63]MDM0233181.1 ATP-binding protein [Variovorax sp. J2R1-6]